MAGFVVARYRVTRPTEFARYIEAVVPTLIAHGAEVVVADNATTVLEGEAPPTTIVLRFESVADARDWYNSPAYQAIRHHRTRNSDMGSVVITEEYDPGR